MRRPRLELPGIPLHITQRGVNRAATFLDEGDFVAYRQALREASQAQCVSVHAYVLMTNHVHLLVSAERPGAVSRMMQGVGRRYVRGINAKYRRTGTLWEGRYKSCLVDSERYLLTCLRYIELNPVRAAMVAQAWDYRWSSVHGHLGMSEDLLLTPHPVFLALDADPTRRAVCHRELLCEAVCEDDLAAVRSYLQQERALGSQRFQQMVEAMLGRPVDLRSPGRPQREHDSNRNVL